MIDVDPVVLNWILGLAVVGLAFLWFRELLSRFRREDRIRKDTLRRSQAVVAGKATEHLVPFLPDFPFDPRDARFLGAPIDLVVFDGLSEGELREIVFVEVKTGTGAALSSRERKIRDAVVEGRVSWHELRVDA